MEIQAINEAIAASNRAMMNLERAQDQLERAGRWGMLDLLGGSLISSLCKHSRINDAQSAMEDAKRSLKSLKHAITEIEVPEGVEIEIGSFLTFADFFFDGLIADWMVQSRINEAKQQVEEAVGRVGQIRSRLEIWREKLRIEGKTEDE